jgi:hypothetical protein
MAYTDGLIAYGVSAVLPRVLDDPNAGKLVRLRMRNDEIITGYFRKEDGSFSRWSMRWTDDSQTCLMPLYPMGANVRPTGGRTASRR